LLEAQIEAKIDAAIEQNCRPLTPEEEQDIRASSEREQLAQQIRANAVRQAADAIGLFNANNGKRSGAVFRGALTMAIPKALHEEGRTHSQSPDPLESEDLGKAAQDDIEHYLSLVTVQPPERAPTAVAKGWVSAECAETLRKELPLLVGKKTHASYEDEIRATIKKQMGKKGMTAKLDEAIANTASEACNEESDASDGEPMTVDEEAMDVD
jgi:hypothetical protein